MAIPPEKRQELLGFVPSPPDPRDYAFAAYVDVPRALEVIPKYFTPYSTTMPIYNQIGPSCVGNSRSLSATIDQRRDLRRTLVYDGEELYAACKKVDGIPHVDGTFPRVALKIQQDRGAKVKKSPYTSDLGRFDKIQIYTALHSVEEIKAAVYLYRSVTLGSTWYDEWFDVPSSLIMPTGVHPAGGHAYTAIGYSTTKQALLIQNSWGLQWGGFVGGSGGRAWLPYSAIDWSDFEAWRAIDVPQP